MRTGTCVVTGKALEPGDVVLTVGGVDYGVKARVYRDMSAQERHALREELERGTRQALFQRDENAPPEYETMSDDDLSALLRERGVELTGRRSKQSKIDALRMADVRTRFADAPAAAEAAPESEG